MDSKWKLNVFQILLQGSNACYAIPNLFGKYTYRELGVLISFTGILRGGIAGLQCFFMSAIPISKVGNCGELRGVAFGIT